MLASDQFVLVESSFRYRNSSCLVNKYPSYKRNLKVKKSTWLTVGKQTGPGANVVQASNPKLLEQVTFTASTQRGAVFKINADLGTNQIAETNAQPLELLSAVVRDANDNLLPNVPVVFTIEEGDASFPDTTGVQATANPNGTNPTKAAQRIILATDKNGLVALRPLIGSVEGTIRIKAQVLKFETGNTNTPSDLTGNATFLIQAKAAQDGPASFSGFVYDDKSKPLSGIKLSIGRTNLVATTDASGKFELGNIPPGRIDLFVDGRTFNPTNDTSKPQYPSLHFEAYAVKGRDNQLAHPIYLPALSTSAESVKTVGGNEDVILTIPGLAGFQMKVKANSVTFPDGSRVGTLIVSPVTADRLPMTPPGGAATFGVPAWTVQPAGTRFDPPIEVTMPNSDGRPVGDNVPIVQWDHDLGQYTAMGRATVSEDGAVLVCDSGSGISKAGWGGGPPTPPPKCQLSPAPVCNDCQRLEAGSGDCPTGKCVFDSTNVNSAEISRPFAFAFNTNLPPAKTVKDLFKGAFGADIAIQISLVGQKTDKAECCKETEWQTNVLSVQGGLQGEASADISLNGLGGAAGRALYLAGIRASVRGRVNTQATYTYEWRDCPVAKDKERFVIQGQIGGALELVLKIGELSTTGGNFTAVGFEGNSGAEVQGIISAPGDEGNRFDVKSYLNVYAQGDVIFLNQKITGVKIQVPLTVNDVGTARTLFP
jgi:hypothetical protein